MENYNSMSFTPEEVKQGLHTKLIKYLLDYNKDCEQHYNDIHITTDGYCLIVEWASIPYDHAWGGSFQYVDFDEVIMHEVHLPDGSSVLSRNEEEDAEIIQDFLNKNSEYKYDWITHEFIDNIEK